MFFFFFQDVWEPCNIITECWTEGIFLITGWNKIFLPQQMFNKPFAVGWCYSLNPQLSFFALLCLILCLCSEENAVITCCYCCSYSISKAPPPPLHPPVVSESKRAQQDAFGRWYTESKASKQTNKDQKWISLIYPIHIDPDTSGFAQDIPHITGASVPGKL